MNVKLIKLANKLDRKGQHELADKMDRFAANYGVNWNFLGYDDDTRMPWWFDGQQYWYQDPNNKQWSAYSYLELPRKYQASYRDGQWWYRNPQTAAWEPSGKAQYDSGLNPAFKMKQEQAKKEALYGGGAVAGTAIGAGAYHTVRWNQMWNAYNAAMKAGNPEQANKILHSTYNKANPYMRKIIEYDIKSNPNMGSANKTKALESLRTGRTTEVAARRGASQVAGRGGGQATGQTIGRAGRAGQVIGRGAGRAGQAFRGIGQAMRIGNILGRGGQAASAIGSGGGLAGTAAAGGVAAGAMLAAPIVAGGAGAYWAGQELNKAYDQQIAGIEGESTMQAQYLQMLRQRMQAARTPQERQRYQQAYQTYLQGQMQ